MRFGAFVPQGWRLDLVGIDQVDHWRAMTEVARKIEALDYESLWVYDHFHTVPVPTQEVTYEAWTLMAALAAVTETVRLGQMCTCNSYRPPSYLAKVATSIDAISGGRVEMGIGAGWYEHEYDGYGYPFPKASVRIGQLREGVEIMQRMWTEDEVTYEGSYYKLDGAICSPKPVQQPHIPFWIAGGGEKLTLNVAARYAQYTNFAQSLEEFTSKSEILAGHCADVGRDYEEIVRSSNFNVIIAETEAGVDHKLAEYREHYRPFVDPERIDRVDRDRYKELGGIIGTPEQIVADLQAWEAEGMTYAILYFLDAAYDTSSLELFAREVMPALH
jgi:F420-dependent oxidoreductase-like protein